MPRGYTRSPEQLTRLYRRIAHHLRSHTSHETARRFSVSVSTVMEARDLMDMARSDTLPEHARFPDTGCDLAPSCLSCPLPVCRYDAAPHAGEDRWERDDRIFALRKKGVPTGELARAFGVSARQVARIVQRGGRSAVGCRRLADGTPDAPATMTLGQLAERRWAVAYK